MTTETGSDATFTSPGKIRFLRLRARTHALLSGGESHEPWARAIEWGLIGLIILNIAAIVLESVPAIGGRFPAAFQYLDIISVLVFTLEYGLRLWSAPEADSGTSRSVLTGRIRFALTPLAIIDLLAIIPFYVGLLIGLDGSEARVLRIFRLFKLARYSSALTMIIKVLCREAEAICATLFVLAGVMVVMASLIYVAEHDAQPTVFPDIPSAFWWAITTLTTVGYGDMVPVTLAGRILGGMTAVVGVGVIALPAGVLASGFLHELQQRREVYVDKVQHAMADGVITPSEWLILNRLRDELEIDPEQAARLIERAIEMHNLTCPHCGHRIMEEEIEARQLIRPPPSSR